MRLLDSISIENSRQGIRIGKLVQAKSFHCDGIELIAGVFDHFKSIFDNQLLKRRYSLV